MKSKKSGLERSPPKPPIQLESVLSVEPILPQANHSRPTEGDTVVVLNTDHAQKYCPQLVGTEAVLCTDDRSAAPYKVRGSDTVWFGESMLRLVRTPIEAG